MRSNIDQKLLNGITSKNVPNGHLDSIQESQSDYPVINPIANYESQLECSIDKIEQDGVKSGERDTKPKKININISNRIHDEMTES